LHDRAGDESRKCAVRQKYTEGVLKIDPKIEHRRSSARKRTHHTHNGVDPPGLRALSSHPPPCATIDYWTTQRRERGTMGPRGGGRRGSAHHHEQKDFDSSCFLQRTGGRTGGLAAAQQVNDGVPSHSRPAARPVTRCTLTFIETVVFDICLHKYTSAESGWWKQRL
jgi:hypothetical protein